MCNKVFMKKIYVRGTLKNSLKCHEDFCGLTIQNKLSSILFKCIARCVCMITKYVLTKDKQIISISV